MPEALVEGRRVAWREAGRGAPAVLIHCMLAHSGAFSGVMARLGDALRMRAVDLPGHGGTERGPTGGGLLREAAENARALLDGAEPAHLVGHSFGAAAALLLAIEAPERVASLTLIEPVWFALLADADPDAYAAEVAASEPFAAAAARGDWPAAEAAFLARWGTGEAMGEEQAAYVRARIPLVAETGPEIGDPARAPLRPGDLPRVAAPTLLVEGGASPATIEAIQRALHARLPDARRLIVAGAGHMVPVTHADAVSGALRDFLAVQDA